MKIAFDWQGTLDVNAFLLKMAQTLKSAGWDVWIISAMPQNRPNEREQEISNANTGLPFRVVYHGLENYHTAASEAKIALMRELGIEWIVDDNGDVARVVRAAGLKALLL